jgi:hypothetical protein
MIKLRENDDELTRVAYNTLQQIIDKEQSRQGAIMMFNAIIRGYRYGQIDKPLTELSDNELRSLRTVGTSSIALFRKYISQIHKEKTLIPKNDSTADILRILKHIDKNLNEIRHNFR